MHHMQKMECWQYAQKNVLNEMWIEIRFFIEVAKWALISMSYISFEDGTGVAYLYYDTSLGLEAEVDEVKILDQGWKVKNGDTKHKAFSHSA